MNYALFERFFRANASFTSLRFRHRAGSTNGRSLVLDAVSVTPVIEPLRLAITSGFMWWPAPASGFVLEESTNIGVADGWRKWRDTVTSDGTNMIVFPERTEGNRFFRLNNSLPVPELSVGDFAGREGTLPHFMQFQFKVSRTGDLSGTTTVRYSTATGSAGTNDFSFASGTLTFLPEASDLFVYIFVAPEATPEPDETFFLNLSDPYNATISDAQAVGTIINDD
ncbi:MAG TPA: Calx-beta domain-containing protein [Candidatus Binatia bacterium]|nr:Calx-beta domain-containing protein [Candidatus Binatia bacterium]